MYKSKYVTLFCVTLHQQPCRPSINLTICLSTSLSYVAITRQSCPTQIYLWQHRPIILSLYFRVDTCLFTDSRTITNIASWCLLMLIHSMVRLLHGAAGRALRSAQLKTGAMYKKKAKQITRHLRCGCEHVSFWSCCEVAFSSLRQHLSQNRPRQKHRVRTTRTKCKCDIPFREERRFLFILMRILVAHSTMSAVETRPDSLWHIET